MGATTYTWIGPDSGDFGDQSNWYNDTAGMSDDGVPGGGDAAIVNATSVSLDDVTLDYLRAFSTTLTGDLTVTGQLEGGDLVGGDVDAGTDLGSVFDGNTLTAATIDAGAELESGTVETDLLGWVDIQGASVSAGIIERGSAGDPCLVDESAGTLTAGSMTLTDASATVGFADSFAITGGTATISGSATVDGSNTDLLAEGGLLDIQGGLSISDGGTVVVEGGGALNVGTQNAGGTLTVGNVGTGSLSVLSNGALTTDDLAIGDQSGGMGTVTVEDADFDVQNDLVIGGGGGGSLTGSDGAQITVDAVSVGAGQDLTAGISLTSSSTPLPMASDLTTYLLLTDAGTRMVATTLDVGEGGSASLTIENGSTATCQDASIGEQPDGAGVVDVDDADFDVQDSLIIGDGGSGSLTGSEGAHITAGAVSAGSSGSDPPNSGLLTTDGPPLPMSSDLTTYLLLTDAGTRMVMKNLDVGEGGSASLTVEDGATATSQDVSIGDQSDSTGIVTVEDGDFDAQDSLVIGDGGSGSLTGSDAAQISAGAVSLGSGGSDLTASILLTGAGVQALMTSLDVSDSGELSISDDASVTVDGQASVSDGGSGTLDGGAFAAETLSIDGASSFQGTGSVTGTGSATEIVDDGVIMSGEDGANPDGGTLVIAPALEGDGTLSVGTNTKLVLDGAVGAGMIADFTSAEGTLSLASPLSMAGTVADFTEDTAADTSDAIDLVGLAATDAVIESNSIVVSDNGASVLTIAANGLNPTDALQVNPDGAGGSQITYAGISVPMPCFVEGTQIARMRGAMPVENLAVGDMVETRFAGRARVRWIGHRSVDCRRHPKAGEVWPVRVRAGAFGDGRPHRDLYLSPDHAVFIDEVVIPVRYLINRATIFQEERGQVTYWHVELDKHDVLSAEGLSCESYLDTGNRAAFEGGGPALDLHPGEATPVTILAAR